MRSTLIALAAAGLLASGGATAAPATIQVNHDIGSAALVPVQYSGNANADPNAYHSGDRAANINEREARIRARIERGRNEGKITNFEARRLYRELGAVEAKERSYKADGRLTYREDAELNRNLDRLAENVRAQMRDDDRTYSYYAR